MNRMTLGQLPWHRDDLQGQIIGKPGGYVLISADVAGLNTPWLRGLRQGLEQLDAAGVTMPPMTTPLDEATAAIETAFYRGQRVLAYGVTADDLERLTFGPVLEGDTMRLAALGRPVTGFTADMVVILAGPEPLSADFLAGVSERLQPGGRVAIFVDMAPKDTAKAPAPAPSEPDERMRLGALAYAAYNRVTGGKNVRGEPCPDWEALPLTIKHAWAASARASIEDYRGAALEWPHR